MPGEASAAAKADSAGIAVVEAAAMVVGQAVEGAVLGEEYSEAQTADVVALAGRPVAFGHGASVAADAGAGAAGEVAYTGIEGEVAVVLVADAFAC